MSKTFGEKLKAARLCQGLTQSELAGDIITRNMLSRLENDQASPSVATLKYLAERLNITAGYFIENISEFDARKFGSIKLIREKLSEGDYTSCERMCLELGSEEDCFCDHEICLILAECRIHTADKAYRAGELKKAAELYESILNLCHITVYDTEVFETTAKIRLNIIEHINGGELSDEIFESGVLRQLSYESDLWYGSKASKSEIHSEYRKAIDAMAGENYTSAAEIFTELMKRTDSITVRLRLLAMLEECAAKSGDFEKAYGCSRKRLEILAELK